MDSKHVNEMDLPRHQAFIAFEFIFTVAGMYMLIAVLVVNCRKYACSRAYVSKRLWKTRFLLDGFFVFYIVTANSKFLLNLITLLSPPPTSVSSCAKVGKAFQFLHAVGAGSLYIFLWLRQNTLYRNPFLKRLATPCLIGVSWVLLAVILLIVGVGTVALMVTSNGMTYVIGNVSGQCENAMEDTKNTTVVYAGYSAVMLTQVWLLFMFVYILKRHENLNQRSFTNISKKRCLSVVIRNCCIAAAITTVTDLAVILCNVLGLRYKLTQQEIYVLWDFDYAINLACTLFCFRNWKTLLFPWFTKRCDGVRRREVGTISNGPSATATG